MPHYHIRWCEKTELDWERCESWAQAEANAKQLVLPGETYTIEKVDDESRPRCPANQKIAHRKASEALNPKYPWQEVVADAFAETRPDFVPRKINAAQRVIAARLCDKSRWIMTRRICNPRGIG